MSYTKHILVTGSNGQLGSELRDLIEKFDQGESSWRQNSVFHFTDREILDITDNSAIEDFCEKNSVEVIINCAAYTAVDKAESEAETADRVNHLAVRSLSEIAKAKDIALIHISTDYVFDGKHYRPYDETHPGSPQSVYGQTKHDGEQAMLEINPKNSLIIRTSWVYSSFGNNFVKTMLRLGKERDELNVVSDQTGSPTYARDLAEAIIKIIARKDFLQEKDSVKIFHYSNEGTCSWYDFAKAIFELAGIDCRVHPISTEAYPTPAARPHFSLLNSEKIKEAYGLSIPYWKDSLRECLVRLKKADV
jgi:dTDP-4-dehydrorhamnose reductase